MAFVFDGREKKEKGACDFSYDPSFLYDKTHATENVGVELRRLISSSMRQKTNYER